MGWSHFSPALQCRSVLTCATEGPSRQCVGVGRHEISVPIHGGWCKDSHQTGWNGRHKWSDTGDPHCDIHTLRGLSFRSTQDAHWTRKLTTIHHPDKVTGLCAGSPMLDFTVPPALSWLPPLLPNLNTRQGRSIPLPGRF